MTFLVSLSDDKLLKLLQKEDRNAYRELYNRYVADLHQFILHTSKSPALAEDVVHDVFVKIWENRSSIDPERNFKPYLFAVAKNHLLNLIKRARNESYILDEIKKHRIVSSHATEDQVNFNESSSIILEAIAKLPDQRKRIFNLCKLEGKSYKQIAKQLGITEGTVNTQMVRALKSIKRYIIIKGSLTLILLYLTK
ncbi:RNA polymerase sigma-70 factor [Pedobacter frigidisoli]|uniref:RNA polymerase sigma factor n=1 Tax=Pedobacter frigidisoli TaxID=2530455 RepID=UPI0029312958|nr:RNA polymerase sigma-70 factor [Pedobacter frigidisoli]